MNQMIIDIYFCGLNVTLANRNMHKISIYTFYLPCRETNLLLSTLSFKALF